jgi:hypothetical protein
MLEPYLAITKRRKAEIERHIEGQRDIGAFRVSTSFIVSESTRISAARDSSA